MQSLGPTLPKSLLGTVTDSEKVSGQDILLIKATVDLTFEN